MNRIRLLRCITALIVTVTIASSQLFIESGAEEVWAGFKDVSYEDWYGESVYNMVWAGVIPASNGNFYPNAPAARQDLLLFLYNFAHMNREPAASCKAVPYTDVDKESAYYKSICWAYASGILCDYKDKKLSPGGQFTKEEFCTVIMRYLSAFGIKPKAVGSAEMFEDSLKISDSAKSFVLASRLAGFINGDEGGKFHPKSSVTRAEMAKVFSKMFISSRIKVKEGDRLVDTSAGAYDWCYDDYEKKMNPHKAYVEKGKAVSSSYFNDAVFVGDSVSMSLQLYSASKKSLGKASFVCAASLSPYNAHWEVSSGSKHPVFKGKKQKVEDAVAASGARKVYIMLGINSLGMGVDRCVSDLTKLIDKILAKSPKATIILQSVTPMTKDSPIKKSTLNNDIIRQYNAKLLELANDNGWYYVNVSEAFKDSEGNLKKSYCSDPSAMGIHFTFEADKVWVDYLITHAPQIK